MAKATAAKLSVPKPVNLPSMKKVRVAGEPYYTSPLLENLAVRVYVASPLHFFFLHSRGVFGGWVASPQEHAGNDPNTQIVPATNHPGGWNKEKADEAPPVAGPVASALAADPRQALSSGKCVCRQCSASEEPPHKKAAPSVIERRPTQAKRRAPFHTPAIFCWQIYLLSSEASHPAIPWGAARHQRPATRRGRIESRVGSLICRG